MSSESDLFLHLIDRKTAVERGLKHYFTGVPCNRFSVAERRVSGKKCLCSECREFVREVNRRCYKENPEDRREYARRYREENANAIRRYREENREAIQEVDLRYREENREAIREVKRRWREENPHIMRANEAKRRAAERNAVPLWFGEFDQFVMQEAAHLCKLREASTGIEWHVDHMIPLRAKKASGLHCATNLQVIPADMNLSKKNRMILTEPDQWIRHLA